MAEELKTIKVSNSGVKKLPTKVDYEVPKGSDWFSILYPNIWLVAKKKSGKTSTIASILDHTCGKNTVLIFVVSTIDKDEIWMHIVKKWKNKGNEVLTYTDINDPDEGNIITNFIQAEQQDAKEIQEETEQKEEPQQGSGKVKGIPILYRRLDGKTNIEHMMHEKELEEKKAEKQVKKTKQIGRGKKIVTPDYCFVFDDQTDNTRASEIAKILKQNRHFKMMTIISSQDVIDIKPTTQKQMDYALLFPKIDDDRLYMVFKNMAISDIDFEKFKEYYHDATKKKYNFFYVSRYDEFRHNFEKQYIVEETQNGT